MPRKILVVEDNLDTRELIHLHLTTEGFVAVVASDGREGLYMAGAEHPDLIITDVSMPEVDGIEMVKRHALADEGKEIPFQQIRGNGLGEGGQKDATMQVYNYTARQSSR